MKIAQHIALILLSCLIMVSSTGFSMYKHYCGSNLKEISLFDEVESCHEKKASQPIASCPFHQHEDSPNEDDNCCTDEYNLIVLEDQVKQLETNYFSNLSFSATLIDLGFLKKTNLEKAPILKVISSQAIPINGPPLYVRFVQFNFYG